MKRPLLCKPFNVLGKDGIEKRHGIAPGEMNPGSMGQSCVSDTGHSLESIAELLKMR